MNKRHLIADVILPAMFIVLIPVLVAIYITTKNTQDQIKESQYAACKRGDHLRSDIAYLFDYLQRTNSVTGEFSKSPEIRRYFTEQRKELTRRKSEIVFPDCIRIIR